jgi:AraC-like DNA-binding protein
MNPRTKKVRPAHSVDQPLLRVSPRDLDTLLSTLDVRFVALSECLVSAGFRLEMGGIDAPGIHYSIAGTGRLFICDDPPIDLWPHTLIVVPPNCPFRIEVRSPRTGFASLTHVDGRRQTRSDGILRGYVAGGGDPEIVMICGFFHASYGSSLELFGHLFSPIIERFDATDQVDRTLKSALAELVSQEIGSGAMSAALLRQVIVVLLRRSIRSMESWVDRFSLLRDPQIARAFSEMAAQPGQHHSLQSLAHCAALSRSAFVHRFTDLLGRPPMTVLRDLRMRQAAHQLASGTLTLDQIAGRVGYESRSSFVRAFRKAYGSDPTAYRDSRSQRAESHSPPDMAEGRRRQRQRPAPAVAQLRKVSHIASNVRTSAATPRAIGCLFQHRREDLHLTRDGSWVKGCEAKQESTQRRSAEDEPVERQSLYTASAGG